MLRQNLFSKVIFLITSFIFVFFIFDTWELSFKDYQSLESQLESRIQKADELRSEVNFIQEKIEDLEDCLLYTSPSPRDTLLSRMPSSA